MGVDIYSNLIVAIPFNKYETIVKSIENVRYDTYTGEKIINPITIKEYIYNGKTYPDFYEMEGDLKEYIKPLDIFVINDVIYFGKYIHYVDCKHGDDKPVILDITNIQKIMNEIKEKFPDSDPKLLTYLEYN